MTSYLRLRNGHYYFRLRVPTDLLSTIQEPEILKSLRTKDRKSARISASSLLSGILQVFTLVRTGFISQEQEEGDGRLLPCNRQMVSEV